MQPRPQRVPPVAHLIEERRGLLRLAVGFDRLSMREADPPAPIEQAGAGRERESVFRLTRRFRASASMPATIWARRRPIWNGAGRIGTRPSSILEKSSSMLMVFVSRSEFLRQTSSPFL